MHIINLIFKHKLFNVKDNTCIFGMLSVDDS